jgi:peptide/nickel transport system substrate-binding protein
MKRLWLLIILLILPCCTHHGLTSASTLFIGLSDPPTTLDPRVASDANSMRICDLLFQGLVGVSRDLKVIPEAASRWIISPERITFFIKPGLKFQNGKAVTLADIENTFVEYKKPSSAFASNLESVKRVYSELPNKIIFELSKQDASILTTLVALKILPLDELKRQDFGRRPIGSGPFAFERWDNGDLILKRFTNESNSNLDEIDFKFVRDENTRYLKILKGELDVLINELDEEKVADLQKTGQAQVLITPGLNFNYILLNLRDPILQDRKFREALFVALHREPIIKYKLKNLAMLALSLLSPINPFAAKDLDQFLNPMTMQEAKRIISNLSKDKQELSLKTSDQASENGQVIAEQLRTGLGLKINHQSFEWATYFSDVRSGRYQLAIMRWVGLFEPDIYRDVLSSTEFAPRGHNRGFYSSQRFDAIVNAARSEMDFETRKILYTKVQQIIVQDLPILPLWYNANISILSKRIKNFTPSVTGNFVPLVNATKD